MAEEAPLIFKVKVDKKEAKVEISNLQKEFARLGKEASQGLGVFDKFLVKTFDLGKGTKELSKAQKALRTRLDLLKGSFKAVAVAGGILAGGLLAMGQASGLLRVQQAILDFQLRQLSITIGDALAPVVKILSDGLQILIDVYNDLDPEQKKMIDTVIQITFVVGLLAIAFGALSLAISPVTIILTALAITIAALIIAWETDFLGIQETVTNVFGTITAIFQAFQDFLDGELDIGGVLRVIFDEALRVVDDFVGLVITAITFQLIGPVLLLLDAFGFDFIAVFADIKDTVVGFIQEIVDILRLALDLGNQLAGSDIVGGLLSGGLGGAVAGGLAGDVGLGLLFGGLGGALLAGSSDIIGDVAGFIGGLFQAGGVVPGSPNQAVPILAHGGEVVLNAEQQNAILSIFAEPQITGGGGGGTINNARTVNIGTINLQTGDSQAAGFGTGAAGDLARGIQRRGTF